MHHTSGEQRATGRERGRDIQAPRDHHDARPQRPGTHEVSSGKEPYRDYAKGTFAGSTPLSGAGRGLPCAAKPRTRCNPRCRLLQLAVEAGDH